MDKMTGISVFVPEKYRNPEAYEEVTSGIYRKRSENCCCISVAADVIPCYPLRPRPFSPGEEGGDDREVQTGRRPDDLHFAPCGLRQKGGFRSPDRSDRNRHGCLTDSRAGNH